MKIAKDKDFELIQPESEDDLQDLAMRAAWVFYYDEKNNLHCLDHHINIDVLFDEEKEEWKESEPLLYKNSRVADFENTLEFLKKNGILPQKAMQDAENKRSEKALKLSLEGQKNTKREIIGWGPSHLFGNDIEDDEHYWALVKDIKKHGYFFAGDSMELSAIFDDYTAYSYSSRGWGRVIANSKDDYGDMAYASFAWGGAWEDELWDSRVLPVAGCYKKRKPRVELDKRSFARLKKYLEMEKCASIYVLLPILGERWFSWDECAFNPTEFYTKDGNEDILVAIPDFVINIRDEDMLKNGIESLRDVPYGEERVEVSCDEEQLASLLKDGSVLVCAIKIPNF